MAKLFVIAGHGAGDPGACANGYQEAERVRALAKRVKELGGDSVMLGDVNRNYYADNGISSLGISTDYKLLELHLDSASGSARGGHVIINGNYAADEWDEALASMIASMFPGRSRAIVGRTDLANPSRAAARGYNYRLLECCFISSAEDMAVFNERIDDLARGILGAFGIEGGASPEPSEPASAPAEAERSGRPTYQLHYALHVLDGGWWGEVTDWHGTDDADGYAGSPNTKHDMLLAYVTKDGKRVNALKYRVHTLGGGWLPWVWGADYNDAASGMAGNWGQAIDGVQLYFETPDGEEYQQAWYRSQTTQRAGWLDAVCDDGDYAGIYGEPLDRLQAKVGTSF